MHLWIWSIWPIWSGSSRHRVSKVMTRFSQGKQSFIFLLLRLLLVLASDNNSKAWYVLQSWWWWDSYHRHREKSTSEGGGHVFSMNVPLLLYRPRQDYPTTGWLSTLKSIHQSSTAALIKGKERSRVPTLSLYTIVHGSLVFKQIQNSILYVFEFNVLQCTFNPHIGAVLV